MPRKQHSHHYIYKTICIITNKFYIGMHSTSDMNDGYIGSGKRLWNSINKHGRNNHKIEILEFLPDRNSLKAREKELVNEDLLKDPMCMNLQLGGVGGFINDDHAKKFHSAGGKAAGKITGPINGGRRLKRLHIEGKRSYDWTGKKHREETKNKMSERAKLRIGKNNSQFGTVWIFNIDLKENRKIKNESLSSYLNNGWFKGRKLIF